MGKRIVIALGGNALGNTADEQLRIVKDTAKTIVDLIESGNDIIITHGNGPQVGMINLAMSVANELRAINSEMPFPECGAMSQGYIGYHLQNSIQNELNLRGINKSTVTLITQVLVDENDVAFQNPTKPIGNFYDKETAIQLKIKKGYKMVEDAGRGYRQVVASPKPVDVIEKSAIQSLISSGHIVITVGGGGIPVISKNGKFIGVEAVIDKDYASAKLAELIDADMLVILTAVDIVYLDFNTQMQRGIGLMSVKEAKEYCSQNQFSPGSMLPKVQACIEFASRKLGNKAVIASLKNAKEAIDSKSGTTIIV